MATQTERCVGGSEGNRDAGAGRFERGGDKQRCAIAQSGWLAN